MDRIDFNKYDRQHRLFPIFPALFLVRYRSLLYPSFYSSMALF